MPFTEEYGCSPELPRSIGEVRVRRLLRFSSASLSKLPSRFSTSDARSDEGALSLSPERARLLVGIMPPPETSLARKRLWPLLPIFGPRAAAPDALTSPFAGSGGGFTTKMGSPMRAIWAPARRQRASAQPTHSTHRDFHLNFHHVMIMSSFPAIGWELQGPYSRSYP